MSGNVPPAAGWLVAVCCCCLCLLLMLPLFIDDTAQWQRRRRRPNRTDAARRDHLARANARTVGNIVRAAALLGSHRGCEPGKHLADIAKILWGIVLSEVPTDQHAETPQAPSHIEVPATVLAATGTERCEALAARAVERTQVSTVVYTAGQAPVTVTAATGLPRSISYMPIRGRGMSPRGHRDTTVVPAVVVPNGEAHRGRSCWRGAIPHCRHCCIHWSTKGPAVR